MKLKCSQKFPEKTITEFSQTFYMFENFHDAQPLSAFFVFCQNYITKFSKKFHESFSGFAFFRKKSTKSFSSISMNWKCFLKFLIRCQFSQNMRVDELHVLPICDNWLTSWKPKLLQSYGLSMMRCRTAGHWTKSVLTGALGEHGQKLSGAYRRRC